MPLGMPHPSIPGALGGPLGPLGAPSQHALSILNKQELHRPEETKSNSGLSVPDVHRNSISPPTDREKYRNLGHERPRSPSEQHDLKKVKKEEKDLGHVSAELIAKNCFFRSETNPFLFLHSNLMAKNPTKI